MKIYIHADMEGISGIRDGSMVEIGQSAKYQEGCGLMMQDINAAIAGAFEGGATEVIATDTHGGGGQLVLEEMDPRAQYERPAPGEFMPSLDETFAGLILLGHHARAGTMNAFLDHTMSSTSIFDFQINGRSVGEIGIEAAYAGHYDVPVIMVSGDQATAEEAHDLLGEVECVVVKWALCRERARCLHPAEARKLIREAARRAVADAGRFKPYKPSLPATLQTTFFRSDMADARLPRQGYERIDARTARRVAQALKDIHATW